MPLLEDLLAQAEPAPLGEPGSAKPKMMTMHQMIELSVSAILICCLRGRMFTAADILAAVPELRSAYRNGNALGTALGAGVSRNGGMRLWRSGPGGAFLPWFENAALAVKRLVQQPQRLHAVAAEVQLADLDSLVSAISALPKAPRIAG